MNKPKYIERDLFNKPLRKPKYFPRETKTIYESVERTLTHMQGASFALEWNSDKFLFTCINCTCIAHVLKVQTVPQPYLLKFQIGCPQCGKSGMKTINLMPKE